METVRRLPEDLRESPCAWPCVEVAKSACHSTSTVKPKNPKLSKDGVMMMHKKINELIFFFWEALPT